MEITDFAKQILFSPSLKDKLLLPDQVSDNNPVYVETPDNLCRETSASVQSRRFKFSKDFSSGSARAATLHFFANHELLAIEIMAKVLLMFPEADSNFRMGIVRTIAEEQEHFRMYTERMNQLGIGFGDIKVNDYFWRVSKQIKSPIDYTMFMSLVFEQANLDYSKFYRDKMFDYEDQVTGQLLDKVYRDEIGHVKFGLQWFDKWRPKRLSLWDEFISGLGERIVPSRAKGIGYDRDGRKHAGLDQSFIDHLDLYSRSKDVPSRVFYFNPGNEFYLGKDIGAYTHPKNLRDFAEDQQFLMTFLAKEKDIVVVNETPDFAFLKTFKKITGFLPEFIRLDDLAEVDPKRVAKFEPWGWSPELQLLNIAGSPPTEETIFNDQDDAERVFAKVYSKTYASSLRSACPFRELDHCNVQGLNQVLNDQGEIITFTNTLLRMFEFVVWKAEYGSSGRGMIRVRESMGQRELNWVKSILSTGIRVIVEPWVERIVDVSLLINSDIAVPYKGYTRFFTNGSGQYLGHSLGKNRRLSPEISAFIQRRTGKTVGAVFEEIGNYVGKELAKVGYRGVAGIDMFFYRHSSGQLQFRPIVEINPRYTMGWIAAALEKRVESDGFWSILSLPALYKKHKWNKSDVIANIQKQYPAQLLANGKLIQGAVFTSDPGSAKASLSVLVANADFEEFRATYIT